MIPILDCLRVHAQVIPPPASSSSDQQIRVICSDCTFSAVVVFAVIV